MGVGEVLEESEHTGRNAESRAGSPYFRTSATDYKSSHVQSENTKGVQDFRGI